MSKKVSLLLLLGLCSYGALGQEAHADDWGQCRKKCIENASNDTMVNKMVNTICEKNKNFGNKPEECKPFYIYKFLNKGNPHPCDKYCDVISQPG